MELRTKWVAIVLLILMLGSLGAAGVALAQSDSNTPAASTTVTSAPTTSNTVTSTSSLVSVGGQIAPQSSALSQYQSDQAAGKVATQTPDGRGLGYVPSPLDLSSPTTAPSLVQATT
jgi:hypothetical protein